MKLKQFKLYNVIFPIWLLWLFPIWWLVAIPANFMIDLIVVMITLRLLNVEEIKIITKSVILKVFGFGFLADFIGTGAMLAINCIPFNYDSEWGHVWGQTVASLAYNPLESPLSIILVSLCVLLSSWCLYQFNYRISLKQANLTKYHKKKLALSLAIATAPYLFYLPTTWFLG